MSSIYWELKPPEQLAGDERIFIELNQWIIKQLIPEVQRFNCSYHHQTKILHIDNWSISIVKGGDLDLTCRRSTGILYIDTIGPLPLFFLLALKRWFKDEKWQNSLDLSYEDSTAVGDDIRKDIKLLNLLNLDSIDSIRDQGEAFGLIKKLIKIDPELSGKDWF